MKLGEMIPVMEEYYMAEPGSMDAVTAFSLESYLNHLWPDSYGYALSLLTTYADYSYEEETNYPDLLPEERSTQSLVTDKETPKWIMVYPNPAEDVLSVRLEDAPLTSEAEVLLTDMLGNTAMKEVLDNRNYEYLLDIRKLAPGAYTLRLMDHDHLMFTQIIIVQ